MLPQEKIASTIREMYNIFEAEESSDLSKDAFIEELIPKSTQQVSLDKKQLETYALMTALYLESFHLS